MHIREFDVAKLPANRKDTTWLDVASRADEGTWRLLLLYIVGAAVGSTLVVTAGIHGDGMAAEIPTLIGYLHDEGELGQRSLAGARAFGAPALWGHPLPIAPGRTVSAATDLGVPWLYTEAPGGGYAQTDDVACFA